MQKKRFGWLIGILCLVAVIALITLLGGGSQNFRAKYEGQDLSADVSGLGRGDTYAHYLEQYADAPKGEQEIPVDITAFEGNAEIQIMLGLFLQAAETLYWLSEWGIPIGAEKRCLS